VLLISLYLVLMYRGVRTAEVAGDHYGQLIATGIVGMVLVQVFVNIGMNIGLTPVTGIPLPFISYGRSSLVTLLLAIGLLQSIAMHQSTASERGLPVVP
jgi:rod shape determining protein RodA